MTPHERALELLALAKQDERVARIIERDPDITLVPTCFHYQQAVEKLLKAVLAEQGIDYPKTHDLVRLRQVAQASYNLPDTQVDLAVLSSFAGHLRYEVVEGEVPLDLAEVRTMVQSLREWVEGVLRADQEPA